MNDMDMDLAEIDRIGMRGDLYDFLGICWGGTCEWTRRERFADLTVEAKQDIVDRFTKWTFRAIEDGFGEIPF